MLSTIEPMDRAIISLYYVWGFSSKEIGTVFGVSSEYILKRLRIVFSAFRRVTSSPGGSEEGA
jgi:DNA-directed RNA polymerase specialized sigma24 family protein